MRALIEWRQASQQWEDFVFRRISKMGNLSERSIGTHHWNRMIQALAKAVDLPNADRAIVKFCVRGKFFIRRLPELIVHLLKIYPHFRPFSHP